MTDTPTREQVEALVASVKFEADKQRRFYPSDPLVPVLDEAADTLAALEAAVAEREAVISASLVLLQGSSLHSSAVRLLTRKEADNGQ